MSMTMIVTAAVSLAAVTMATLQPLEAVKRGGGLTRIANVQIARASEEGVTALYIVRAATVTPTLDRA